MPKRTVKNNAASDSRPQGEHAHAVVTAGCTQPELPHGGGVSVVFQDYPRIQPPLNLFAHRVIVPARQVRRLAKDARSQVNYSRYADADATQRSSRLKTAHELADVFAHRGDDPLRTSQRLGGSREA